jgi:hypothetical protein
LTHRRIDRQSGNRKMEFALSPPKRMDDRKRTPGPSRARNSKEPGWAEGLRQLYDSVVHEPLPDSFDDLLKKLDRAEHEND